LSLRALSISLVKNLVTLVRLSGSGVVKFQILKNPRPTRDIYQVCNFGEIGFLLFSEKFLHFLFVFFILTFRLCFEVLQVIECKFNLILIFWNGFILDQHFKYFNNLCVSIFSFLHYKISTLYNDFVVVKLLSLRLK